MSQNDNFDILHVDTPATTNKENNMYRINDQGKIEVYM